MLWHGPEPPWSLPSACRKGQSWDQPSTCPLCRVASCCHCLTHRCVVEKVEEGRKEGKNKMSCSSLPMLISQESALGQTHLLGQDFQRMQKISLCLSSLFLQLISVFPLHLLLLNTCFFLAYRGCFIPPHQ